jgi:hypothetical protein
MFYKLKTIYLAHFKVSILLNLWVSLYFLYFFWKTGFDNHSLYTLTLFFKAIAYGAGLAVEKLLSPQREFYYRNMGISYRRLFGILYLSDLFVFIALLIIAALCRNFI